jgi:hypothetical protein
MDSKILLSESNFMNHISNDFDDSGYIISISQIAYQHVRLQFMPYYTSQTALTKSALYGQFGHSQLNGIVVDRNLPSRADDTLLPALTTLSWLVLSYHRSKFGIT